MIRRWACRNVVVLIALALLAGCSDESNEGAATNEAASTEATTEETTTETGPEPITAAEKRWVRALNRYHNRFTRIAFQSGQVTHASMRREAGLARDCRKTLLRGAQPGRFEPAAKIVERACKRLDKAAALLDQAIAVSDPGGAVLAGSEEEEIFNRSFNGAAEAMGNADFDLQRALNQANSIEADLPNG
jgi:hypothetical protein